VVSDTRFEAHSGPGTFGEVCDLQVEAGGESAEIERAFRYDEGPYATDYVAIAYADAGMHCMDEDFSEMMILPPGNNLRVQVFRKRGEEPDVVTGGVTVRYVIPSNTRSADKTNFWDYAEDLTGRAVASDTGLTGQGLAGTLVPSGQGDWVVEGIPLTPINDSGEEDPYPLALITVEREGQVVARTETVLPVSWEMGCARCHNLPGMTVAEDILSAHDSLEPDEELLDRRPVRCGKCHAQAPLGDLGAGRTGVPSLSEAMHGSHAERMDSIIDELGGNACYGCHPGERTQCLRGIHLSEGKTCVDCHGTMEEVASPTRRPWIDEPRCDDCHERSRYEFEQPGRLFKDSSSHKGVFCAACHGSQHAIAPTLSPRDNLQAIALQGHPAPIDTCDVCHSGTPEDGFFHRRDD
jgi:hypothetical protein